MGGLCKSESTPVTTKTISDTGLPEWVSQGGKELFDQSKALSQTAYQPYTGQRVAGMDPAEQQGYNLAQSNVGAYQPNLTQANTMTQAAGQQWTPEVAQQYSNPFQQQVTDYTMSNLQRQFDTQDQGLDAAATAAGAFGGARHGIAESEALRNQNDVRAQSLAALGSQGYDAARGAFSADRNAALSAGGQMGNLAQQTQMLGAGDVSALGQAGALGRGIQQQNLGAAYGDFQEQRDYPYKQLNFSLGALNGVPVERTTTSTNQGQMQQASPLTQGVGALGALYSGYKLFQ